jgi:DNA polymerase elongation subunit (family B)
MQPCDWIEHDYANKYVIDVYGRNEEQECIMLRIQGFKPYLYVKGADLEEVRKVVGLPGIYTIQDKYDVFEGYNDFKPVKVCKIQVDSIREYRQLVKTLKELKKELRVYEANLPPLLRFYHDHEISPASPLSYMSSAKLKNEGGPKSWTVNVHNLRSDPTRDIPLLISAYDIECMSKSGQFPIPSKEWSYVVEKIAKDLEEAPEDETLTQIIERRITLEGGLLRPLNIEAFVRSNRVIIESENWATLAREMERACGPIGDPVIQIGVTLRWSNNMLTNVKRRVFVVGGVTKHAEYVSFPTEADMIEGFMQYIQDENPDVICGYNTYGFDDNFLAARAKANGIKVNLARGPMWGDDPLDHKTFELASGKYSVNYIRTPGRLTIDLLLNMRREHNLDSYTLDNVASTFLRDKVVKCESSGESTLIYTKTTRGLCVGNFIRLDIVGNTINPYMDGKKFLVKALTTKTILLEEPIEAMEGLEWSFTKDDIHPHDLFRMHEGTDEDRATIAKYCIQDCDLVLTLMAKLDTLSNARGMADVCFVPLQFLFLRGQGIKIFSRVAYEASKRDQVLLTQESFEGDSGYEGAIVISPKIGMYLDTPVAVLDFNSLYPSSMIGENLSPDTFVCMKTYNASGKLIEYEGIAPEKVRTILNCHEISYDVKDDDGKVIGRSTCVYVQPTADNPLSIGLIPMALEIMLKKRKEARHMAARCAGTDDSQAAVYNGLQLAYKVVANSIYGQLGSKTSAIRKICVAACTTAVGRRQLLFAKETVEKEFGADVIYGDTDSIFIKYPSKTLVETIKLAQDSAELITKRCPHKAFVIGYEKTFYPFILFCRKRYVGMKYEEDPTKCKRASMGVVLKRRDNAPIVKDVFGGALDILLVDKDVRKAVEFVKSMLLKVVKGELPIDKFAITKQLRDDYKAMKEGYEGTATIPAHRILADRMAARDPGNKPNVGDRLKFVYIQAPDKRLQCDKIEHIAYAAEKKLPLDTLFYVTNQIQNPVAQLFALCIEDIPGYRHPSVGKKKQTYEQLYEEYMETLEDHEQATLKVLAHKEKQLDGMLFLGAEYIQNTVRKSRTGPLDTFFKPKK